MTSRALAVSTMTSQSRDVLGRKCDDVTMEGGGGEHLSTPADMRDRPGIRPPGIPDTFPVFGEILTDSWTGGRW